MKGNVDQSLIKVNTASQNTTSGTRSKLTEKGTYLTSVLKFTEKKGKKLNYKI